MIHGDFVDDAEGKKVFGIWRGGVFKIPWTVGVGDDVDLRLIQSDGFDDDIAMEERPEIEDGVGAGDFEDVAGRKKRRALYAERDEVNGWPREKLEADALDLDFFAGGLFEVGNDLRAVVVEVEPERGEENCEEEGAEDCGEGAKDDFAARGHARSDLLLKAEISGMGIVLRIRDGRLC